MAPRRPKRMTKAEIEGEVKGPDRAAHGPVRDAWKAVADGKDPSTALARVDEAVRLVASDEELIEQHPDRDDILRVLTTNALLADGERMSWREISVHLKHDYGIDLTGSKIQKFVEKNIVPALFVTPEFIRQGVFTAGIELNTAKSRLEVYEKLRERYDDLIEREGDEEEDPNTLANLARSLDQLSKGVEETLERYSMIPGRKVQVEGRHTHVNVDMDKMMERMSRSSRETPTIEVEAVKKESS